MSDLSSMIDNTTERLLRKVDNIKIPQSDKKMIMVEKEVYESVLRVNCNKIAECERLQKQLDMAKKYLNERADKDKYADWVLLRIDGLKQDE